MADKLPDDLEGAAMSAAARCTRLSVVAGVEREAEITRLNAENERLKLDCASYEATMRAIAESSDGAELARLNALVDEMREGLTDIGSTERVPKRVRTIALALITKASRE